MIMKIANTWIKHILKKDELRFKQKLDLETKETEEENRKVSENLNQVDKHIENINAIKLFCDWDEYTKFGISGYGITQYDEKVSILKSGLEKLIADSNKKELAYTNKIGDYANELKVSFSKATRIWHESVLGQDHEGEKSIAAGCFRTSMETAGALANALSAIRKKES